MPIWFDHLRGLPIAVIAGLLAGVFSGMVSSKFYFEEGIGNQKIVEERVYLEDSEIVKTIEKVNPAVVSIISTSGEAFDFFNIDDLENVYGGTGFIVDSAGLILTNKHVVSDEDAEFKAILNDGREFLLEILSVDPFDDVAVLKIKTGEKLNLPVLELGNSDDLKIGQKVVAIGNALAVYGNTVTAGIISAKGRDVSTYNDFGGTVQNLSGLLQTDAAINLGNSGGPLVSLDGKVIGMNTAIAELGNNIGFAIPSNDLKPVIVSVKEFGEIIRPVLGVNFIMLDKNQSQEFDVNLDHGALLIDGGISGKPAVFPAGAAAKAGLRELDIILSVDGMIVDKGNPLQRIIRNYKPGDEVKLEIWRDGKKIESKLVLKNSRDLR